MAYLILTGEIIPNPIHPIINDTNIFLENLLRGGSAHKGYPCVYFWPHKIM